MCYVLFFMDFMFCNVPFFFLCMFGLGKYNWGRKGVNRDMGYTYLSIDL